MSKSQIRTSPNSNGQHVRAWSIRIGEPVHHGQPCSTAGSANATCWLPTDLPHLRLEGKSSVGCSPVTRRVCRACRVDGERQGAQIRGDVAEHGVAAGVPAAAEQSVRGRKARQGVKATARELCSGGGDRLTAERRNKGAHNGTAWCRHGLRLRNRHGADLEGSVLPGQLAGEAMAREPDSLASPRSLDPSTASLASLASLERSTADATPLRRSQPLPGRKARKASRAATAVGGTTHSMNRACKVHPKELHEQK